MWGLDGGLIQSVESLNGTKKTGLPDQEVINSPQGCIQTSWAPLAFLVSSPPAHTADPGLANLRDHMSQLHMVNVFLDSYTLYWFCFSGELYYNITQNNWSIDTMKKNKIIMELIKMTFQRKSMHDCLSHFMTSKKRRILVLFIYSGRLKISWRAVTAYVFIFVWNLAPNSSPDWIFLLLLACQIVFPLPHQVWFWGFFWFCFILFF